MEKVADIGQEGVIDTRQTWFVIFIRQKEKRFWWQRIGLKYDHVFAVTPIDVDNDSGKNHWLYVEQAVTNFVVFSCTDTALATALVQKDCECIDVLKYTIDISQPDKQQNTINIVTRDWLPRYCVTVIKRLLRIYDVVITPNGLYNSLLKHGAKKAKFL